MSTADNPPDRSLLAAATRGDAAAAQALLQGYLTRLRAFVRMRMPADLRARESSLDVVQSVCCELLGELDGFEFRGEADFRGWLFTAALNKLRNKHRFQRQQKRDRSREGALPEGADMDALLASSGLLGTPSQVAIGVETMERLERAFDSLPEHYREVISLARIAGLPHAEIARRLDKTEQATRQLLGRALVQLATTMSAKP